MARRWIADAQKPDLPVKAGHLCALSEQVQARLIAPKNGTGEIITAGVKAVESDRTGADGTRVLWCGRTADAESLAAQGLRSSVITFRYSPFCIDNENLPLPGMV